MIGKLKGIVDLLDDNALILDVGGVGYVLFISLLTAQALPGRGEAASLFVETHVREDHIHLYGFASADERDAFRILNRVSGVGTKVALAILSVLSPAKLATAIAAEDKNAFRSVSGVGPKLAARLITELKDKFALSWQQEVPAGKATGKAQAASGTSSLADAVSALVNLGYSRSDAFAAIGRVENADQLTVSELVRAGLKAMATV